MMSKSHCRRASPKRKLAFRRNLHGFTLLEVTIVSGLMAVLAVLLSSTWIAMGRPTADLIVSSRLLQEMNMAVAALERDVCGSLANSPTGKCQAGKLVGLRQSPVDPNVVELCYDGGSGVDLDSQPQWDSPGSLDTVVGYQSQIEPVTGVGLLVRSERKPDGTTTWFTAARNLATTDGFTVTDHGNNAVDIDLTFTYHSRTWKRTIKMVIP
jgi:prepilin-type N-terminal cleavage/methylation domain-containing protein